MQNKEKLNQIGASVETSPRKSSAILAEQTDISIHLRQMSYKLKSIDYEARLNFVNWYLHGTYATEKEPHNCSISWQTPFHLNGNMNHQTRKCHYIMLGLVVMCYECNQVYLEMKYNIGHVYSDVQGKRSLYFAKLIVTHGKVEKEKCTST